MEKGQIDILLRNGFKEVRDPGFVRGRGPIYIINNTTVESDEHFILRHLTYQEIMNYTEDAEHYLTKEPDIIFKSAEGKTIAVEIETDKYPKNQEELDLKLSILQKYDEWFFILTNYENSPKYEPYGTIITRTGVKEKIGTYFKTSKDEISPESKSDNQVNLYRYHSMYSPFLDPGT